MKRIAALLLLAAFPGCGGMPTDSTNPTGSANVVGTCNTAYYNSDFRFGFDLPPNAESGETTSNEGNIVFRSDWSFMFEGRILSVQVLIAEDPGVPLADWVALSIETFVTILGEQLLEVFPFTLADGTNAYFYSVISSLGLTIYKVDVIANGYAYRLATLFPDSVPTDAANAYMITILDSLCVD